MMALIGRIFMESLYGMQRKILTAFFDYIFTGWQVAHVSEPAAPPGYVRREMLFIGAIQTQDLIAHPDGRQGTWVDGMSP